MALLDEMYELGPAPDVMSFNGAISACGKGLQWERAISLLDEMQCRGVAANGTSFAEAIWACEKGSQWETAICLLDGMNEQNGTVLLAGFDPTREPYLRQKVCDMVRHSLEDLACGKLRIEGSLNLPGRPASYASGSS